MTPSRALAALAALTAVLPASLRAQGGAEGGGALYDINTGLSAWTLLVFAALVIILGKYAWGPILAAVEAREKRIQAALDEAAARQAEAARLLEQHREQLADARRQASEVLADARQAADRVRRELEEKARAEAQGIIERARAEIGRERDAALETLRKESIDLALAATAKLLEQKLDLPKDRELVERYLGDLTPRGGEGGGARA